MTNELTTTATNDLRHTIITTDSEGNFLKISIRLNDECKNGHQDFAITASAWKKGKPHTDRYNIYGGCCHDEILKVRPDLKIFVNLHLCDYEGIPTYAVENGFYHLTNGFNSVKREQAEFKAKFCEYYRISTKQFDALNTSKNQLQYALKLQELGILTQWKAEANKAIELLQEMAGKEFLVDSVKTQFHAPTPEQLQEEKEKQENGYYTPAAEAGRQQAKKQGIIDKLIADRDKEINKATEEFEVKIQVLEVGGETALNNCIYYNHSRTLSFNWKSYDRISTEQYDTIAAAIKLPEGVQIQNANK